MPRKSLRTPYAVVALCLLALACWLAGIDPTWDSTVRGEASRQAAAPTADRPALAAASEREGARVDPDGGNSDEDRDETTLSRLLLRVRDGTGGPVSGIVSWSFSASAPLSGDSMPMFAGEERGGIHQSAFTDAATIEPRCDQWTWVKITRKDHPVRAWYLRVAPFVGVQEREMVLATDTRALHVFVWNPQWTGPAVDRKVTIFTADLQSGTPPRVIKTLRTDATGYAFAKGLPPGRFFVAGPGSGLRDSFPYCCPIILPETTRVAEATCTVVATPEKEQVELRVHGSFSGEAGTVLAPRLFLKRVDDDSGQPYPVIGVLREGDNQLTVDVPPGRYSVDVVPVGSLAFRETNQQLDVRVDKKNVFAFSVGSPTAWTLLRLEGVDAAHFPVIVHPRRLDALVVDDEELIFLGTYRWRLPTHRVPELPFPCRLVVSGRGGHYVSSRPVEIRGSSVAAAMMPASRVTVQWSGTKALACPEAILVATGGGGSVGGDGSLLVRFRRELVRSGGQLMPARVATFTHPVGPLRLECRTPDDALLWSREESARGASLLIAIGE